MKSNIILVITLGLASCTPQHKPVDITFNSDTVKQTEKVENSKYYTQQDTILITTETSDTLTYARSDFNNIVDNHPEFFEEYPENPDQAYSKNNDIKFESQIGQDCYYILYAYFLKQRNGIDEYSMPRKKLIDIYTNINSLFGYIQYGGTYFGHQCSRISGYAEYSIYLLSKYENDISKTYDISRQKELYIKSLRQLIEDENSIDYNTLDQQEKTERVKNLNEIVNELDMQITNNFYLRRAQEFQYCHYQYY